MRKLKVVENIPKSNETLNEQIAQKAFELYQQRGGSHGDDLNDWLTAERLVLETTSTGNSPLKTKSKVVAMRQKKTGR